MPMVVFLWELLGKLQEQGGTLQKLQKQLLMCTQARQERLCLLSLTASHSSFPSLLSHHPYPIHQLRPPIFWGLWNTSQWYWATSQKSSSALLPSTEVETKEDIIKKRKRKGTGTYSSSTMCLAHSRGSLQLLSFWSYNDLREQALSSLFYVPGNAHSPQGGAHGEGAGYLAWSSLLVRASALV